MAAFITENDVREKFQLTDTTLIVSSLVARNINDAHLVVLRFLDPQFDTPTPDAALVLGETLLAGAYLLRSLASSQAFQRKKLTVGGQQLDVARRYEAMVEHADAAETQAWHVLEPFLQAKPADRVAGVTDSQPVIEEG